MEEILTSLQPWTSAVASILSLAALGLILRIQSQRVEALKDRAGIIEERRKASEDEVKRLEKIHKDLSTIGASLGIDSFKDSLPTGVSTRDIGDNFSGKIAGRDINEMINRLGDVIKQTQNKIGEYIDHGTKNITQALDRPRHYNYKLEFLFTRQIDRIKEEFPRMVEENEREGWNFDGVTSDYQGTDGMVLVFKRVRG